MLRHAERAYYTEHAMADVTIRLRPNGPLVIEGPFKLVDSRGAEFEIPSQQAGHRPLPLRPVRQTPLLRRHPQNLRLRLRRSANAAGRRLIVRMLDSRDADASPGLIAVQRSIRACLTTRTAPTDNAPSACTPRTPPARVAKISPQTRSARASSADRDQRRDRPRVRLEPQRHAGVKQKNARIHRVPHDRVNARIDNMVLAFALMPDHRRRESCSLETPAR